MPTGFPGAGHKYFVDFTIFKVELDFASDTSLTYYNLDDNNNKVGSETVTIKCQAIADGIWLVTWQESDKGTATHIEDYNRMTLITNYTDKHLNFLQQQPGTFCKLP